MHGRLDRIELRRLLHRRHLGVNTVERARVDPRHVLAEQRNRERQVVRDVVPCLTRRGLKIAQRLGVLKRGLDVLQRLAPHRECRVARRREDERLPREIERPVTRRDRHIVLQIERTFAQRCFSRRILRERRQLRARALVDREHALVVLAARAAHRLASLERGREEEQHREKGPHGERYYKSSSRRVVESSSRRVVEETT
jgi:hypothetical protein